eukprot:4859858-Pleurochrysis_carterae.AAC.1
MRRSSSRVCRRARVPRDDEGGQLWRGRWWMAVVAVTVVVTVMVAAVAATAMAATAVVAVVACAV